MRWIANAFRMWFIVLKVFTLLCSFSLLLSNKQLTWCCIAVFSSKAEPLLLRIQGVSLTSYGRFVPTFSVPPGISDCHQLIRVQTHHAHSNTQYSLVHHHQTRNIYQVSDKIKYYLSTFHCLFMARLWLILVSILILSDTLYTEFDSQGVPRE